MSDSTLNPPFDAERNDLSQDAVEAGRKVPFRQLLESAGAGDQAAATLLVERYGGHVRRAVRRMLPHRMRSLYDSEDFGQAVWKSFFEGRSELVQFADSAQLIAHLATLARNKVIDESRRRLRTKKHDMAREQRVTWDSGLAPADTRTPSPSEVAIAGEVLERLVESTQETTKRILALRIAGRTSPEIAALTGLDERAVRRAITQLATLVEE